MSQSHAKALLEEIETLRRDNDRLRNEINDLKRRIPSEKPSYGWVPPVPEGYSSREGKNKGYRFDGSWS